MKTLSPEQLAYAAKELGLTVAEVAEMVEMSRSMGLGVSPVLKERLKANKPALSTLADILKDAKAQTRRGAIQGKVLKLLGQKHSTEDIHNAILSDFNADEIDEALEVVEELKVKYYPKMKSNDFQTSIKEQLDTILGMLTVKPYDSFTSKRLNAEPAKPTGPVSLYDSATSQKLNGGNPALSAQTKELAGGAHSLYDAMTSRVLNPDLPAVQTKAVEESFATVYDSFTSTRLNREKTPKLHARTKEVQAVALSVEQVQQARDNAMLAAWQARQAGLDAQAQNTLGRTERVYQSLLHSPDNPNLK